MKVTRAPTEQGVRRQLIAHSPGVVTRIPLTGDRELDERLRRFAEHGACVIEQDAIEEDDE